MASWVVGQDQHPLTNSDVVKMVKSGLPASVIANAIQANQTNFDVSANGLIALQKAGVPQNVMDAMISASSKNRSAASSGETAAAPATSSALPGGGHFAVSVTQGGKGELAREKTQLAQTKTKANSLGSLAADSAVNRDGRPHGPPQAYSHLCVGAARAHFQQDARQHSHVRCHLQWHCRGQ
jgi:hypothetical protein